MLLLCKRNAEPWGGCRSWCQHKGLEEGANLCQGIRLSEGAQRVVPWGEEPVVLQGFSVLTQHGGHSGWWDPSRHCTGSHRCRS